MKCPYCGEVDSKVIDSRPTEDGEKIRRRRECLIDIFEGYVLVIPESLVTVKGGLIVEHGTVLAVLCQQGDEEVHELEECH